MEEEFAFLEKLRNTTTYQEMVELSRRMDEDESLKDLSTKRDSYFQLADSTKDEEKKHEYLLKFNQLDEELRNHPMMKEYLKRYQEIRKLLNHLQDGLTKEIMK